MLRSSLSGRQTAVLILSYPSTDPDAQLALDVERRYQTSLTIDGRLLPAQSFASPFGDEVWRDAVRAIRQCVEIRQAPARPGEKPTMDAARRANRRRAEDVRAAGRSLFRALGELNPQLRRFLEATTPRRLVIESDRPEIHALSWEALTDEAWHSVAAQGLSIVHCIEAFSTVARSSPGILHVTTFSGPGVKDDTIEALRRSVPVRNQSGRSVGIEMSDKDDPPADLVHILAHGDKHIGFTGLDISEKGSAQLADRLCDRLMIALWSCYSAMVRPWEASPAQALHKSGNALVLGFSAPLHFDTSAAIAGRFYDDVFGARGQQDAEAAVTAIRASLFEKEFEFCDWASMTLWMRQPIDLTALPLGRVRVPSDNWSDRSVAGREVALKEELQQHAALGDISVLQSTEVKVPLPRELVRDWGGSVVHFDGPAALVDPAVYTALDLEMNANLHPADAFRALLDRIASFRYALILWTNATANEALLVQTLPSVPANVCIVVVSPYALTSSPTTGWPGRGIRGKAGELREPEPESLVARFLYLVGRDRFKDALKLAEAPDGDIEYWSARYSAFIKQGDKSSARGCIDWLSSHDGPIEADLLDANLRARDEAHLKARELYQRTADLAFEKQAWRELARARQELAYVANEMGDRGLAVQMYESAIGLLESLTRDQRGPRWTSALARALRDYADLLSDVAPPEALPMVDRATAIHALEGRVTQVAYCRVTRSRLLCRLGRYDDADVAAHEAAIVFDQNGNLDGWDEAVRLIARIAAERNRYLQALAVLGTALTERQRSDSQLKPGRVARILLQMAQAAWALGRLDETLAHSRRARALLKDYQPEWREAARIIDVIRSLHDTPPRVAAVAGRRLTEGDEPTAEALDRIRVALARAFMEHHIEYVVCSAARGADLLALEVAGNLGIRREIVLPFSVDRFRQTSVDPPGSADWRKLYNDVTQNPGTGVIVLEDENFGKVTTKILEQARKLSHTRRPLAIVVWDGPHREGTDYTADFKDKAQSSFETIEIPISSDSARCNGH